MSHNFTTIIAKRVGLGRHSLYWSFICPSCKKKQEVSNDVENIDNVILKKLGCVYCKNVYKANNAVKISKELAMLKYPYFQPPHRIVLQYKSPGNLFVFGLYSYNVKKWVDCGETFPILTHFDNIDDTVYAQGNNYYFIDEGEEDCIYFEINILANDT